MCHNNQCYLFHLIQFDENPTRWTLTTDHSSCQIILTKDKNLTPGFFGTTSGTRLHEVDNHRMEAAWGVGAATGPLHSPARGTDSRHRSGGDCPRLRRSILCARFRRGAKVAKSASVWQRASRSPRLPAADPSPPRHLYPARNTEARRRRPIDRHPTEPKPLAGATPCSSGPTLRPHRGPP